MTIIEPKDYGVDESNPKYKTFLVVDSHGNERLLEWDSLRLGPFRVHVPEVKAAIKAGKTYIGLELATGYHEIQWD